MAGIEDRLAAIEQRYKELSRELEAPDAYQDIDRVQRLSQEQARLRDVVNAGRRWQDALQAARDAETMAATESDAELVALAEQETREQRDVAEAAQQELHRLLLPSDPNDERDVVVEIRAGTGGDEAALFAADLFRMYTRYAERRRWSVEVLEQNETAGHGFKEIVFEVHGRGAYSRLKYESGVHRVQRVPETEAQGRIHTSAASVVVLPEADEVEVTIDDKDLRIEVFRSTGPGGQSVNTTDSAVRITHLPTGIVAACQNERSQHKNRSTAMKMLKAKLYELEVNKRNAAARVLEESKSDVSWGNQIRSYVLDQSRIKDLRTGVEVGNTTAVLDGDLDPFLEASLKAGV